MIALELETDHETAIATDVTEAADAMKIAAGEAEGQDLGLGRKADDAIDVTGTETAVAVAGEMIHLENWSYTASMTVVSRK